MTSLVFNHCNTHGSARARAKQTEHEKLVAGVKLMKTGETQRFWVPPNLGYGSQRTDGGPCGPLVFDVYLESFKTDNPLFR